MPTKAEAIAAGKAMEAVDDQNFFDPADMRGIGWDDICEDLEGEDLRNMESAISGSWPRSLDLWATARLDSTALSCMLLTQRLHTASAAYESHPGAYGSGKIGAEALYYFNGLLKLHADKKLHAGKKEVKRSADSAGDDAKKAKKQDSGTAKSDKAEEEKKGYSATYHDMEQPWVELPHEAWVKLTQARTTDDEETQFPKMWDELKQVSDNVQKLSPRLLLIGLLEWADASKAGRFLASCPWPATQSMVGLSEFWRPSQPTNQGGLGDYLQSVVCLRPALDVEALKRAGTIIGAAWEPFDKNGRASDLIKQMIWLGTQASDGHSRFTHEHIYAFVSASGFHYASQDGDDSEDD